MKSTLRYQLREQKEKGMDNHKIKYDKNGRVVLDSKLVVLTLLDRLVKEEIINVKTYIQAKNEILWDIKTDKNFP